MRELQPFEKYLIHEFVDDYIDGLMTRRDMIKRVLYITGGVAATATVLTSLGITPMTRAAYAQETTPVANVAQSPLSVAADDPRIAGADITFINGDAVIMAYTARPTGATADAAMVASPVASPSANGALPVVLVCHENRGLTDHIKDVTRRWAVAGYYALAVDLVSRDGGTAAITDPAEIPGLLTKVDTLQHVADFQAAIDFLMGDTTLDPTRVAMTGFCFGGGVTWRAATQIAALKAAAPFYGPPPPLEDVPNIKAAMLGIYSDDPGDFANEGRDDLKAALDAAGVTNQFNIYPGTQHAFHNDTGQRYNEEQAIAAWNDAVAWFAEYV